MATPSARHTSPPSTWCLDAPRAMSDRPRQLVVGPRTNLGGCPCTHNHKTLCQSGGKDVDVAPSLAGATLNFMIIDAMPPYLIQHPAMMGLINVIPPTPYMLSH